MTTIRITLSAILFAIISMLASPANAQSGKETFKVWGNCDMCKKTIETALKVDGVKKATWNVETKQMLVKFDPSKISLDQIHQKIAAVGYDTDKVKGDDTAYNNLHGCCQYERRSE